MSVARCFQGEKTFFENGSFVKARSFKKHDALPRVEEQSFFRAKQQFFE